MATGNILRCKYINKEGYRCQHQTGHTGPHKFARKSSIRKEEKKMGWW